jgi:hypothetical protein
MERYSQQFAITPSDTVGASITNGPVDALYIGGGDGTLRVVDDTGQICNYVGLLTGRIYPFAAREVRATGTGATGIKGLKR